MAEASTKATDANVEAHLAAISDPSRRADCVAIAELMHRITGEPPKMWGPTIVGFGSYYYQYESGHKGNSCLTGFASRRGEIVIYLVASGLGQEQLLAQLGKHKMGKACLYIRRLSDVNAKILEKLIVSAVAEIRRRYG